MPLNPAYPRIPLLTLISLSLNPQLVTHAPHGVNELFPVTSIYLAPQVTDVNVYHVGLIKEIDIPNVLANLSTGEHLIRVAHEIL